MVIHYTENLKVKSDWLCQKSSQSPNINFQSQASNLMPAKIIILGDHGVGKSALIVRFLTKRFIGKYNSQTDIKYIHTLRSFQSDLSSNKLDEDPFKVEFLDMSPFKVILLNPFLKTFENSIHYRCLRKNFHMLQHLYSFTTFATAHHFWL